MSFYSDMQGVATGLIGEFGQRLTFTRETYGEYDPATGTTPVTVSSFDGTGVEVEYSNTEIDGTRIKTGDKKLIMSVMDTPPAIDDKVSVNGIDYRVLVNMPKNPAGTVLTYELQVRV